MKQILDRLSRIAKANYNFSNQDNISKAEEYLNSTAEEDELSKLINQATKNNQAKESSEYIILGVKRSDNIETIKKAYRSALLKNHPDKFSNASIEQQELSRKKTDEIIAAYNKIMKERGQKWKLILKK